MRLSSSRRKFVYQVMIGLIAIVSGVALVWMAIADITNTALQLAVGTVFTLAVAIIIWLFFDPDTQVARQSDELLMLASEMLDATKQGMTPEAAQTICELLLPATPAIAVAITDRENIQGYAGYNSENNASGSPIRTTATRQTIEDGLPRILYNTEDIGLPMSSSRINAAIVQPLYIGSSIEGTLKFYYRRAGQISKTQQSVSYGFAELLSTQMAASALEEQLKLTTSMELKALQAQINPHFLFNTINTIASLIRTDPQKARELLREFAVFYRSTLEDAEDLIPLEREIRQAERYIAFEVARFGDDRLQLIVNVQREMNEMLVPSFLVQPLVENAVKHAMRAEGKLTITLIGKIRGDNVIISVKDDGVGMSQERLANMMDAGSSTGLGIAVRNVKDRISGYFGPGSYMNVESELGKGTVVTISLDRAIAEGEAGGYLHARNLRDSAIPEIPQPVVD